MNLDNVRKIFLNKEFNEIFTIIFPEFRYLDRFKYLNEEVFRKFIKFEKKLLYALLLIDETDNHAYFAHKYKISNNLREYLNFLSIQFNKIKKNKNYFIKDLKKNIFYHGKTQIISLSKFYFISNPKKNYEKLENIIKTINSTNIPDFPISGKYLLEKGFQSGRKVGEILKKVEKEWVDNDFNLNDKEIKNLINKYI